MVISANAGNICSAELEVAAKSPQATDVWTNAPFVRASTMQSSSPNFYPPPDLVLWKLNFPHVFFSGGVFFHRHRSEADPENSCAAESCEQKTGVSIQCGKNGPRCQKTISDEMSTVKSSIFYIVCYFFMCVFLVYMLIYFFSTNAWNLIMFFFWYKHISNKMMGLDTPVHWPLEEHAAETRVPKPIYIYIYVYYMYIICLYYIDTDKCYFLNMLL